MSRVAEIWKYIATAARNAAAQPAVAVSTADRPRAAEQLRRVGQAAGHDDDEHDRDDDEQQH